MARDKSGASAGPSGGASSNGQGREFTMAEVAKHHTRKDCWVVFEDKVLDLSPWIDKHPGGELAILAVAGTDATEEIVAMHPPVVVNKYLKAYVIGKIVGYKPPEHLVAFRELVARVMNDPKWTQRNLGFYFAMVPRLVVLLACALYFFLGTQWRLLHLLGGACLGLWWQQVLLIGHDAGHNSIFESKGANEVVGWFVGTLSNGFSIAWWKRNHNTHHVATNSVEHDPDIQHMPFLAISDKFFEPFYSTYYERHVEFDSIAAVMVPMQGTLFVFLMMVSRIFVHTQSFLYLLDFTKPVPLRAVELVGMVLYFSWFFCLTIGGGLHTGKDALSIALFAVAAHVTVAIIHMQITLNHFASDDHSDKHNVGARGGDDFVTAQLKGTCDITCAPNLDWFHGGLQFQVEHHLLPRLHRRKLRALLPEIEQYCKKYNLPYESRTFPQAYVFVRDRLARVGLAAAERRAKMHAKGGLWHSVVAPVASLLAPRPKSL